MKLKEFIKHFDKPNSIAHLEGKRNVLEADQEKSTTLASQTHLWLIKVWFSASTFVVKIATFAKPETVMCNLLATVQP